MHLYRIAQEAINNGTKHGKAANSPVSLIRMGSTTTLRIADDGPGISKTANGSDGMGLGLMFYRARLVGGELRIEEPPAGGAIHLLRNPVGAGGMEATCRVRHKRRSCCEDHPMSASKWRS